MVLLAAIYGKKILNSIQAKKKEKLTDTNDVKLLGDLGIVMTIFVFILILAVFISFIVAIVKSIKLCGIESIIHIFIMFIFYPYVIIFLIAGNSICSREDTYNNRRYNNRR